jgi:chromate transporter
MSPTSSSPTVALTAHLAVLSLISFGGIPAVLPEVRDFVVATHGWVSDREFANMFAVVQSMPGPNMVVMISLIGWKLGGLVGALSSALAIFGPACMLVVLVRGLWDRYRAAPWQRIARRGLAPVTIGLVIAGGVAMAGASATGWPTTALTLAAMMLVVGTRLSPLWAMAIGGALGGLGLL